jgi:hypothetical protein
MRLPESLYPLFWDCRPETIDPDAHAPFVLERVLEYGSLAAVRWAVGQYGPQRIRAFLRNRGRRTLTRKTLAFWTMILGLENEECFQRTSLDRSRTFWNY